MQLTILSTLPEEFLRSRIDGAFNYIHHAADFGLKMKSSLEIDLVSSAETYKVLHANWNSNVNAVVRNFSVPGARFYPCGCAIRDTGCLHRS